MERLPNLVDRPILARSEVYNYLIENFGIEIDKDRCIRDVEYANSILLTALSDKTLWKVKSDPDPKIYCVTFTTRVQNGKAFRSYPDFMETFRRIVSMRGVNRLYGNFELTQQNILHAHVIIETDGRYLDTTKVRRFNKNEFIKVDKIKSDKHLKACLLYIGKAQDDEKTLEVLKPFSVDTTYVDIRPTPSEPLALLG